MHCARFGGPVKTEARRLDKMGFLACESANENVRAQRWAALHGGER